ncbi:sigma-70 family RNA polymerase sigma factor [Thauera linaloolentis]|nr:sigma-70 family RNA polymerase sigma factor [Thauera linaloolentis]MCM8565509.1 sigma-70 family RNA polymerase sigma factor [Thauera linaloolentis]
MSSPLELNTAASAEHAVEALYRDHHQWLFGWLRRKLGCAHRADDFAHDTFVRILSAVRRGTGPDLRGLHEPRAFLTTAATRVVIDHARRQEVERVYLETQAVLHTEQAAAPSPEQLYELAETLTAIARMLDGLAEKPRAAFLLYRLEGLPQGEIAARLGVSTSMVKQYVAQAMVHCYAAQYAAPGG